MKKEYKEEIVFIHSDGKKYTFKTERNLLNDNQMYWFEPQHTMYYGKVSEVKKIAKNIKEKCKIINKEK